MNLAEKPVDDLTKEDKKKLDEVCFSQEKINLFSNCIESKIIDDYGVDFSKKSFEDIKKLASDLSIDLKDKDDKELSEDELFLKIKKKVLVPLLKDLRLKNKDYPEKVLLQTEELLVNAKLKICNSCGLKNNICEELKKEKEVIENLKLNKGNTQEIKNKEEEIKEKEAAARKQAEKAKKEEAEKAVAAEKLAKSKEEEKKKALETLEKEKKQKEVAEAQAKALKKKLEAEISNKVTKQLNSEVKDENSELESEEVKEIDSSKDYNYNPYNNMKRRVDIRKEQREQIYLNPVSSGHLLDKYYSSLNNKPPGYSYIDPRLWTVPQKRPPVCHFNNDLSAVPLYDSGTHINVLELTPYGDIATTEKDVKQTNVGSILPQFQYREFS